MKNSTNPAQYTFAIPTGDGQFLASYSSQGLSALRFPAEANGSVALSTMGGIPDQILNCHAETTAALSMALVGRAPPKLPRFDLSSGTQFQREVWRTLLRIERGRTWSYAQVAQAIGRPAALRAVGRACGANPIPVLVPCHRVLASNHALGGFSAGLEWKRLLLKREGSWPS